MLIVAESIAITTTRTTYLVRRHTVALSLLLGDNLLGLLTEVLLLGRRAVRGSRGSLGRSDLGRWRLDRLGIVGGQGRRRNYLDSGPVVLVDRSGSLLVVALLGIVCVLAMTQDFYSHG